ncbi:MAG: hypothetical protein ACPGJS_20055 [Flammeovirgaceae bacterium]
MDLTESDLVLAGLGNLQRKRIDPKILEFQQGLLLKMGSNKHRRKFLEQLPNLPKEAIDGLMKGSWQILDKTYYARVDFGAGTSVKVIDENTDYSIGVANMKDGMIDPKKPFVLSGLSLEYSATAPNAFAHAAIAAEINRGEFEMKYGSSELYNKMPIAGFFTSLNNYKTDEHYAYRDINNPKVMVHDEQITFYINIPTAFASGTHAVGVRLHGTEVRKIS